MSELHYHITLSFQDGKYQAVIQEAPVLAVREDTPHDALLGIAEVLAGIIPHGGGVLNLWTIYASPTDYPGKFVARRFEMDRPTSEVILADTLDEVRSLLPRGLTCIGRSSYDEPQIVETWL